MTCWGPTEAKRSVSSSPSKGPPQALSAQRTLLPLSESARSCHGRSRGDSAASPRTRSQALPSPAPRRPRHREGPPQGGGPRLRQGRW